MYLLKKKHITCGKHFLRIVNNDVLYTFTRKKRIPPDIGRNINSQLHKLFSA